MAVSKSHNQRRALASELLELMAANAPAFDRMSAIKTELKAIAADDGKFRETFVDLGYVSVSPEVPERVVGEQPVIDVAAWQGLTAGRRAKLAESGLVSVQPIVKGAYYGSVNVNLHADA